MAKTVVGLIDNSSEAQKVVEELLNSGFDRKHIGLISSDVLTEAASAIRGASAGIAIGGIAGMLLAAAAIAIPGIGPALVAGPALTLLAGTTIGALAGGLIGGLRSRGVPEDEAHFYAEGLSRGGTLITVNAENDELAARAVEIMKRHGAVDMEERVAEWKNQGWSGRYDDRGEAARAAGKQRDAVPGGAAQPLAGSERQSAAAQPSGQSAEGRRSVPTRGTAEEPVDAERTSVRAEEEPGEFEPVALSAVQVYSFVIEMPADENLESAAGATTDVRRRDAAANQPKYSGPERRTGNAPYGGTDRRHAA